MQDILDRRRTEARQALRPNPNAWQQARPRAAAMRPSRPARVSLGEVLQRLLERGAAGHAWKLFGGAVLAWALALLCTAWLLGVFP
ncbi:hypothetical protein [Belnapia sp. F-4-1]|uniref:hypothetical protein n=1 Tax=Belnapia sp. F-4-1 TaxID=1545443 RepID=UPI0005B813C5|nr:hypothetical protein [Belnapia sp. F-4-1]